MKTRILTLVMSLLAIIAVGCGSSSDDFHPIYPGDTVNPPAGTQYLRIGHAVPAAQNYDVYVNDTLTFRNISYGQFTDYVGIAARARVKVTRVGNSNEVILDRRIDQPANTYSTLVLTGAPLEVTSTLYQDDVVGTPGTATIRIINSSSGDDAVRLTRLNGDAVVGAVEYPFATDYVNIGQGANSFQVRDQFNNVLATTTPANLVNGAVYTVYLIGQEASLTQEALLIVDSTTAGINGREVVTTP